jgi:hypothetical protein
MYYKQSELAAIIHIHYTQFNGVYNACVWYQLIHAQESGGYLRSWGRIFGSYPKGLVTKGSDATGVGRAATYLAE